jgi:carboxyl-terminal processing protease
VLSLLVAFALGTQVERRGWLPSRGGQEPPEVRQTFRPFWETWRLVHDHYADQNSVNNERMMQGAIRGMLDSLGDLGHTNYLTKEGVQRLMEDLKGELYGIGANIDLSKQRPTIINTLPKSPARTAGLKPGDAIVQVDGKDVQGIAPQEIVKRIRGPAGSTVHLKVLRGDPPEPVELDIERARVDVPDVAWQMLPGTTIAQVALRNFGERTDEHLRAALDAAREKGAKALVLDVRGNPGGLKEQAVKVSSEFLQADAVVFIEKNSKGKTNEVRALPGGVAHDIPLCVLINEASGSSSEIFAGAIQDHERGKLIGKRTIGLGTVLGEFKLSDGSAVLLAIDEWLTPKERRIWHKGISPDIEVSLPQGAYMVMPESETKLTADALAHSDDKQLLRAIEVLEKELH